MNNPTIIAESGAEAETPSNIDAIQVCNSIISQIDERNCSKRYN